MTTTRLCTTLVCIANWSNSYGVSRKLGTFQISLAARNTGSALPTAIGTSLAKPDLNTVCFSGDGGLLMHLPEFNVIAQEGLPVKVVVFVDGGWGTIRVFQRNKDYPILGGGLPSARLARNR
ncbi:MAG: hypothetical protein CME19_10355 [Gemmatimonadetes bacterium]|nr:hypothetical protein [Gemmatimonadota bacterium]